MANWFKVKATGSVEVPGLVILALFAVLVAVAVATIRLL
ncbi:hypothetical protein AciPR4_0332 [Terriglobus saanensis SP1PR4]|uniref:Uncharacterized protein n=1 Tax=Terriglobus saanensis (strain ATCC BAA-1853 / DSM 23119 / SP1PR4) TaxID=401053 RepID=E8V1H4_TERSS|nr:hypothetical protein AciPR4_0332 [Terriglobus saanensis SP1PR4]